MDNEIEILENEEGLKETPAFHINLSLDEKIKCLEEIIGKLKKILYVYDKTQEPESNYNYKIFCGGILIYVSSSNLLFNGELVNIVAILTNDFDKPQLKRIVFETINQVNYLLKGYKSTKIKIEQEKAAVLNSSNKEN